MSPTPTDRIESRLLNLAAVFLGIYSLALSLAPIVRTRSLGAQIDWMHWIGFAVWIVIFNLAQRSSSRRLPYRDPYLLPVAALLLGFGLLTIYRLIPEFGLRQTLWLTFGLLLYILGLRLAPDFRFLRRYKYLWLTGGLILTGLTFLLGTNPLGYGPQMWLGCCGIYLQPSEPLKLLLVIYLSAYLADRYIIPDEAHGLKTKALLPLLAPTLIMTGLALSLLIIQRDLGTASIFLFLYAVMIYIASDKPKVVLIALAGLAAASLAGIWFFDVVRVRIEAWLNPWLDPSGRSFQLVQSLLAIANGGIIGRGPGLGSPGVVPVAHSDFIFAALFEETGLIGAFGLISLIAIFAIRGLRGALLAPDRFRRFLAAGLVAYLAGQSVLIMAGNVRMLPLTGVTLPFVSYGGSSLLVSIISLLFLVMISNSRIERQAVVSNPQPIVQLGRLLLVGLALVALISSWWVLVRSPALLTRTDNPRRAISDRYVRRGSILDRQNTPINQTDGTPGSYNRQIYYPDLSPVIGYTNPIYGQAGLEASLDSTLRGLQGNPPLLIWWNHLLYGQPPPGLDIRTSLDLGYQEIADRLMKDHPGALVLLNASNGEILSMASHPTFNANRLEELGETLLENPTAPLLNRAAQGQYPPGTALGALLYARALMEGSLPESASSQDYSLENQHLQCSLQPTETSWGALISNGCPGVIAQLGEQLGLDSLRQFYRDLGLFAAPQVHLPVSSSPAPAVDQADQLALGTQISVSPLQMALAAAPLSATGVRPAAHLVTATNDPKAGWTLLPPLEQSKQVLSEISARLAASDLAVPGQPFWQSVASAQSGEEVLTWFLAGTLPDWQATPLTLVILLEEDDPMLAQEIGQKFMGQILNR